MTSSRSKRILRALSRRALNIIFWVGFGVNLHAVANELYYKAGYMEILKFQGEYIGLVLMAVPSIYHFTRTRIHSSRKRREDAEPETEDP